VSRGAFAGKPECNAKPRVLFLKEAVILQALLNRATIEVTKNAANSRKQKLASNKIIELFLMTIKKRRLQLMESS
jgi:hypothetical protein